MTWEWVLILRSGCVPVFRIYVHTYQELITVRVCNSHMVSIPAIWIGRRRQSAVNMLSCENTTAKRWSFAGVFTQLTYTIATKYLLNIFTADCLCHYCPDGRCKNHKEVAHSYRYKISIHTYIHTYIYMCYKCFKCHSHYRN